MTAHPTKSGTFAADGSFEIGWREGEEGAMTFANDFGGGTITAFYLVDDTYVAFVDSGGAAISYTDDGGFEFTGPSNGLRITLAGSTSPDLDFKVTIKSF